MQKSQNVIQPQNTKCGEEWDEISLVQMSTQEVYFRNRSFDETHNNQQKLQAHILMNRGTEIVNKTLLNKVQQHMKWIMPHDSFI